MTDNNFRNTIRPPEYIAPEMKTINVKARQVLCQSHGVEGWNTTGGSKTGDIDMEEYGS